MIYLWMLYSCSCKHPICLPPSQNKIGAGRLMGPKGVAVDKNGHIITVDNKACCVFIFQSNGKLVTKFGGRGTSDRQFAGENERQLAWSSGEEPVLLTTLTRWTHTVLFCKATGHVCAELTPLLCFLFLICFFVLHVSLINRITERFCGF